MRPAVLVVVLACLPSGGCLVASLHPVYGKTSIRFDPTLVGTWEDQDGQSTLVVEAGPWQSYKVKVTVQSRETALTVYETQIDNARLVDLTPEHGLEASPISVPTHAIARLTSSAESLEIRPLDYDWFRRMIEQGGLAGLSGVLDERENVLIASPADVVRRWIGARLTEDAVFGAPLRFVRRR
jgi:hypothetical protein